MRSVLLIVWHCFGMLVMFLVLATARLPLFCFMFSGRRVVGEGSWAWLFVPHLVPPVVRSGVCFAFVDLA